MQIRQLPNSQNSFLAVQIGSNETRTAMKPIYADENSDVVTGEEPDGEVEVFRLVGHGSTIVKAAKQVQSKS